MSMNKYMHCRNIYYKNPPDFKQLALDYPEFRKFVVQTVTGKVNVNFQDPAALSALSTVLLKKDFGLDVIIPTTKLIPTIPLRLNYILWLEDLLDVFKLDETPCGLDIGTGASCIYPLLGAKKNKWSMLATEIDEQSVENARQNVSRNNLDGLIEIIHVTEKDIIPQSMESRTIHFTMCNPPFYSKKEELNPFFKARKPDRPRPKNAFCAKLNEVVSPGGEFTFIERIINESRVNESILLFTTMVGHKAHLMQLKKLLREAQVFSFEETEFCQGNTTRWGLAWTFHSFDLRKTHKKHEKKLKAPLVFELASGVTAPEVFGDCIDKVLTIFKGLQMTVEEVTRNKLVRRYFVHAYANTWSHQRRKRRQNNQESPSKSNREEDSPNTGNKRALEELCPEGALLKKLKISDNEEGGFTFCASIQWQFNEQQVNVELNEKEAAHRDELHQILQYIKNNFK